MICVSVILKHHRYRKRRIRSLARGRRATDPSASGRYLLGYQKGAKIADQPPAVVAQRVDVIRDVFRGARCALSLNCKSYLPTRGGRRVIAGEVKTGDRRPGLRSHAVTGTSANPRRRRESDQSHALPVGANTVVSTAIVAVVIPKPRSSRHGLSFTVHLHVTCEPMATVEGPSRGGVPDAQPGPSRLPTPSSVAYGCPLGPRNRASPSAPRCRSAQRVRWTECLHASSACVARRHRNPTVPPLAPPPAPARACGDTVGPPAAGAKTTRPTGQS